MVRKIEGKIYRPFLNFENKSKAQVVARNIRAEGKSARIVKLSTGPRKYSVLIHHPRDRK